MARIACFYGLGTDHELDEKLTKASQFNRAKIIRLFCRVAFKTKTGWTNPFLAIIDTGAYISVVPHDIWSVADVKIYSDHYVRGLVPKAECKLDVKTGELSGVLVDRQNASKEYKFLAFLASKDDSMPLILGFAELLEELKLFSDPTTNTAWLEEP
jgi:hypothetical protein